MQLVALALSLLVAACASRKPVSDQPIAAQEYEVIREVLRRNWGDTGGPIYRATTTHVSCLDDSTVSRIQRELEEDNPLAEFDADLFPEFSKLCGSEATVDSDSLGFPAAQLATSDRLKSLGDHYLFIAFSRVAFSRNGEQALLVMHSEGPWAGDDECLVLQRLRGAWRIIARTTVEQWIR